MATPDTTGPDDADVERKLQAWELKVEGRSLAYIGEKIGVPKTTAWRWVTEGRDLAAQLDYLAKTRERETGAAVMELVRTWMVDLVDRDTAEDKDIIAAAQTVIKAEERRSRLLGLDAPTRLDVNDGRTPAVVEGRIAHAIGRYDAGGDPTDEDTPR